MARPDVLRHPWPLPTRGRCLHTVKPAYPCCCVFYRQSVMQILSQGRRKKGVNTCHSLPGPNASSHQDTNNSQLFFDLLLVWQQLSSRFSGAEGQHEAHLLLTALKLTISAQSQQRTPRHGQDDRHVPSLNVMFHPSAA